ncbi:hypothetical protein AVEN_272425-1 [Araneus ventricosus]|uniref:Uncharacterized protein n=1 Tax=Araneus ventricosus TaxID=182803 RepID=A0A4Y2IY32_ARAVE|nr:hypothetical protein AVEN_272425-1 [Araneus ventricosus]
MSQCQHCLRWPSRREKGKHFQNTFYDEEFFEVLIKGFPTEGRFLCRTHAKSECDSGPDGTTHHGAQQGKAVTGSEFSQPRHVPWCLSEPIRSESPPETLTTLNAKAQRMTLSLDPLKHTNQVAGIPAD